MRQFAGMLRKAMPLHERGEALSMELGARLGSEDDLVDANERFRGAGELNVGRTDVNEVEASWA
jgi:hypothetical protein